MPPSPPRDLVAFMRRTDLPLLVQAASEWSSTAAKGATSAPTSVSKRAISAVASATSAATSAGTTGVAVAIDPDLLSRSVRERHRGPYDAALVLGQPIVDAALVSSELGVRPENSIRSIRRPEEGGVLVEFTGFARNRMWQSREVMDVLDDFAARAARRTGASREQPADVLGGER